MSIARMLIQNRKLSEILAALNTMKANDQVRLAAFEVWADMVHEELKKGYRVIGCMGCNRTCVDFGNRRSKWGRLISKDEPHTTSICPDCNESATKDELEEQKKYNTNRFYEKVNA